MFVDMNNDNSNSSDLQCFDLENLIN